MKPTANEKANIKKMSGSINRIVLVRAMVDSVTQQIHSHDPQNNKLFKIFQVQHQTIKNSWHYYEQMHL